MKRAAANRKLLTAKELIGHTHFAINISSASTLTVDWLFNEMKRVFEGDRIDYKGSGKRYVNWLWMDTVYSLVLLCTLKVVG